MKIAHISDLHLNTLFNDSNLQRIKRTLRYISAKNVDHLIISGDLVDNADESDLLLLKKMISREGYLSSDKLTIVPGNHDIFGGPQKPDDIFSFPDRCIGIDYTEKVKSFNQIFKESFSNTIFSDSGDEYPFAKIIGNILIIGVNSIAEYSKFRNPFASNGEISLSQFHRINNFLEQFNNQVLYKMIVVHHHFNKIKNTKRSIAGIWQNVEKQTMKLRKKRRLMNLFSKYNVDIILHGHIHFNEFYERNNLAFLNAGATTAGYSGKSLRVNLIDMNNKGMKCELHKITEDGNVKTEELYYKENKTDSVLSFAISS